MRDFLQACSDAHITKIYFLKFSKFTTECESLCNDCAIPDGTEMVQCVPAHKYSVRKREQPLHVARLVARAEGRAAGSRCFQT